MTFNHLGLSQKTLEAVEAAGFSSPTPIQEQAIPVANSGRDLVGIAQTGTGKTAGFVLPMLTRLESGRARARMPRSLILEPTRELAAQVEQAFDQLGVNHKLNLALLIGGVSFDEQFRKLDRGADVLIATPGRLLDHFQRGKLLLTGVEILVIDEADRMLDMGFIPDIEKILSMLPPQRQTLFFSATMPKEVKKLADKFLKDPVRIEVSRPAMAATTITQKLRFSPSDIKSKREILRELIDGVGVKNAIVFCNRKRDVGVVHRSLIKHGYNAGELHGDMEQRDRMATLDAFRKGTITILAASDVAARGLDIPAVSHIFNFDVPITPEDYVHRIGRTGRAGREGYAAMLVTPNDMEAVRAIEKLCEQKIEWLGGEPSSEELEQGRSPKGRRGRSTRSRSGEKPQASEKRASSSRSSRGNGTARPAKAEVEADTRPARAEADARPARTEPDPRPARAEKPARAAKAEQRDTGSNVVVAEAHPAKKPARSNESRGRRNKEPEVVGMGDHVPAFLLTPIRRSR
jgi:superfamily II DNA/RNA helicase